ncbi:hypothetical protein J2X20_000886 [Pelomonas saccharophila]|uniref:Uncharacterized protein n=1 Tax=Roseateles saccharophilus TaxID=304 RepID=A0ABU1YHB5_ROSSA|nr:hypothetical protein [Roseateles saccharophilus]MDR7268257.1 hypothetical protein [Roseateles saccharophilus]
MPQTVIDVHNGIRFQVEVVARGPLFEGRFTLLDTKWKASGVDDPYRPATENAWATETEALNYATEAAHHVIEGIEPFVAWSRNEE